MTSLWFWAEPTWMVISQVDYDAEPPARINWIYGVTESGKVLKFIRERHG